MFRKFLVFFVSFLFCACALAEGSDALDYRSMGPKEQAQSYLIKLQDPDGSVRRDGASLLSRVLEQNISQIGSSKEGDAFMIEVGSGLTGLAQVDNSTIRVRAERLLDQLVHGYMAASASNSAPMKEEGARGLKFLGARTSSEETRALISGALAKLKMEMPVFDPVLVVKPEIREPRELPRLAPDEPEPLPESAQAKSVEAKPSAPAPTPVQEPAPVAATVAPVAETVKTATPAPTEVVAPSSSTNEPVATPQPSSTKPKKIVVRSLSGAAAAPASAPAADAQVVTVSIKSVKKPVASDTATPAAPTLSASPANTQDKVVLKMLAEKLMANDEGGKLVGLDLAQKLSDNIVKASASEDLDLKSYAENASQALRRLISDPSSQVREKACGIAGMIGDKGSAPLLISRLEDGDQAVRKAAQKSLYTLVGQDLGEEPTAWKEHLGL